MFNLKNILIALMSWGVIFFFVGCIKVDVYHHGSTEPPPPVDPTPTVTPTNPPIIGSVNESLTENEGVGKLKAGAGFSSKGWNSNNYGKIEYKLQQTNKGFLEVEVKGFSLPLPGKFCESGDGKYHIIAGSELEGNKIMSAFRLRITSGENEMKLILSGKQGSTWGSNVTDCQFKNVITDANKYYKYRFEWNDKNFKFYIDDNLMCENNLDPGFLMGHFYIGHDMNRQEKYCEDVWFRNLKIGNYLNQYL